MSDLFDNISLCRFLFIAFATWFFVLLFISVVITSGAILSASSSGLHRGQKIEVIFRRFSYKQEVGRFEWRRFSFVSSIAFPSGYRKGLSYFNLPGCCRICVYNIAAEYKLTETGRDGSRAMMLEQLHDRLC